MPVEIAVGPPQLVINQGDTILVTDNYGQIPWPSDKGLYFLDTRLISSWNIAQHPKRISADAASVRHGG